jgi:hypothetical protein
VFTISMPPEMAEIAEAIAKREHWTMSELFCQAFRAYRAEEFEKAIQEIGEYAKTRNPHGYTEEDIPRLVKEVRAEMRAEKETAKLATTIR